MSRLFHVCSFPRTRDTVCNHFHPLPTIIMCLEPMSPWELLVKSLLCFVKRTCLNVSLCPMPTATILCLAVQHCLSGNEMTCWPSFHLLLTASTNWGKFPSYLNMWPAERKTRHFPQILNLSRGNFILTGRFLAKFRLLHQGVTGGLHCIILNYEARLCYYKDTISLNSQAGQWNTGVRCYGQLKHAFSKKAISQASSLYTVVFLSIETM